MGGYGEGGSDISSRNGSGGVVSGGEGRSGDIFGLRHDAVVVLCDEGGGDVPGGLGTSDGGGGWFIS